MQAGQIGKILNTHYPMCGYIRALTTDAREVLQAPGGVGLECLGCGGGELSLDGAGVVSQNTIGSTGDSLACVEALQYFNRLS